MSTRITDIHTAIYTLVAAALPDHTELYKPSVIDSVEDALLDKSYGIVIGPASNTKRFVSCDNYSVRRDVVILNTITIYGADLDETIRKNAEKELLENQIKILRAAQNNVTLTGLVSKFDFENDNGLEFIFTDETDNIMLQSTYSFEYIENIT